MELTKDELILVVARIKAMPDDLRIISL